MELLVFLICLIASAVGAICGIGGGIIIKPVLDAFDIMSVQQVSFLSGCTVLCMAAYTVFLSRLRGERELDTKTAAPLALGAAAGGVVGKLLFQWLSRGASSPAFAQAVCLLCMTLGTFFYALLQSRIKTHSVEGAAPRALIGLALGLISSFLGIGGGPINLVALSFLFSMEPKTAAKNSIYIILVSQAASLLFSLFTQTVPDVSMLMLLTMALGGVGGGILGRLINKRILAGGVHALFLAVNVLIIFICAYNIASAA